MAGPNLSLNHLAHAATHRPPSRQSLRYTPLERDLETFKRLRTFLKMSAVDDPAFGLYGRWEASNPDCIALGVATSNQVKMIQLLFASICFCQVLFMASRAPRVTWEAVYLPLVETVLYGLAATGNGQMRLADGRLVPIARFCSWLITCPIMLFQVVSIHEVRWKGVPVKNMVMAAALIRTVFGIGASVTTRETMRWVQYSLSCGFFFFELTVVYQIFQAGLQKFSEHKTTLNGIVYTRVLFMRFLFFLSWNSFPIIWLLSNTGLCVISENASVLSYLVADLICKNVYGIINTNTLFRVLDGKWVAEKEERKDRYYDNHIGETYLEMMMANFRGGGRQTEDDDIEAEVENNSADGGINLKSVRVDGDDDSGFPTARSAGRDAAGKRYGQCKSPENFYDDRNLPAFRSRVHDTRDQPRPRLDMACETFASSAGRRPAPSIERRMSEEGRGDSPAGRMFERRLSQDMRVMIAQHRADEDSRNGGRNFCARARSGESRTSPDPDPTMQHNEAEARGRREWTAMDREELLDFARRLTISAEAMTVGRRTRSVDPGPREPSSTLAEMSRGRIRERPTNDEEWVA